MKGMYEIVLEESFQPAGGRAYHSESVIKAGLTLIDAQLETKGYNDFALSGQYFFYRETK